MAFSFAVIKMSCNLLEIVFPQHCERSQCHWITHFKMLREFPGGPVVMTRCFHCRGLGLIPGGETKIPQAVQWGQKKKQKSINSCYINFNPIKKRGSWLWNNLHIMRAAEEKRQRQKIILQMSYKKTREINFRFSGEMIGDTPLSCSYFMQKAAKHLFY